MIPANVGHMTVLMGPTAQLSPIFCLLTMELVQYLEIALSREVSIATNHKFGQLVHPTHSPVN